MSVHVSAYKSLQEKFSTQVSPCLGSSGLVMTVVFILRRKPGLRADGVSARSNCVRVTRFRDNSFRYWSFGNDDSFLTRRVCVPLRARTGVPRVVAGNKGGTGQGSH